MSNKNSLETIGDNIHYYFTGFGLYYLLNLIFMFYPAFILTMALQRGFYGMEETGESCIFGLFSFVIMIGIIFLLMAFEKYIPLLIIYLITLYPFINILIHYWHAGQWENGEYIDYFPLPLDWCPFW